MEIANERSRGQQTHDLKHSLNKIVDELKQTLQSGTGNMQLAPILEQLK